MDILTFIQKIITEGSYGGISATIYLIGLFLYFAVVFLAMGGVLKKAGRPFYYGLIPLFNRIELFDIAWSKKAGFVYIIATLVSFFTSLDGNGLLFAGPRGVLHVLALAVSFVLALVMKLKLSYSFHLNSDIGFGLVFMEVIFLPILARNGAAYHGRTLYRKGSIPRPKIDRKITRVDRGYMLAMYEYRSILALISAVIVLLFSLYAIASSLTNTFAHLPTDPTYSVFHYFTTNSNLLSALGSAFLIPYAVAGIRKKHFVFPKWISMLQYSAAICTTVTMSFAFIFILPTQGVEMAVGHSNFWLHVVCPLMALVLFYSVESDNKLSRNDTIRCMMPFFAYALLYYINVVAIGEQNGGWRDIYLLTAFIPAELALPLMFMFSFMVAAGLRHIYNELLKRRHKQLQDIWPDDASPVEVKIEIYGLGRYYGKSADLTDLDPPLDIFILLRKEYGITIDELLKVYNKGVLDGLKERKNFRKNNGWLAKAVGVPEEDHQQGVSQ